MGGEHVNTLLIVAMVQIELKIQEISEKFGQAEFSDKLRVQFSKSLLYVDVMVQTQI